MNRSHDATKKVHCTSSKEPFYWPIESKIIPNVPHSHKVIWLQFERDPMNKRRDAAKKVLCTSCKVRFFLDRSQPNLYQLWQLRSKWNVYNFSEISWIVGVILRRRRFVYQVKWPSLLSDRNQIYINCGACAESDMFTVSVRSLRKKGEMLRRSNFLFPVMCPSL